MHLSKVKRSYFNGKRHFGKTHNCLEGSNLAVASCVRSDKWLTLEMSAYLFTDGNMILVNLLNTN